MLNQHVSKYNTEIVDWNGLGCALQGDVIIKALPKGFEYKRNMKVRPFSNGPLIIAYGEISGHDHALFRSGGAGTDLLERPTSKKNEEKLKPTNIKIIEGILGKSYDETLAEIENTSHIDNDFGHAELWSDTDAISKLAQGGELTVTNLAIGILEVQKKPVIMRHDEHKALRIPVGNYYVGGQQEFDADRIRRVQD